MLLAGPITIFFVLRYFNESTQGYFYTFRQLLALRVFTELGLGTVIIQFASHEWAHLSFGSDRQLEGSLKAQKRLGSIASFSVKWFTVGGVILFFVLLIVGSFLFSAKPDMTIGWLWPWLSLSTLTCLELMLIPIFSILIGCNDVLFIYIVRLVQSIAYVIVMWVAMGIGAGLWSLVAGAAMSVSVGILMLISSRAHLLRNILKMKEDVSFNWRSEMLPMQWRIALSWISGYFVFNLFTPVLFHFQGPQAAGQMGMSLSVVNTLAFIPSLWMKPNMPKFGMYIAKKKYFKLDEHFFKLLKITSFFLLLSALVLWGAFYIINYFEYSFASRMLPMIPITLLILTVTLNSGFSPFSDYLRAHKKEPMVIPSVLSAILIATSNIYFGSKYGALGMTIGYFCVALFFTPIVFSIWYILRKNWHSSPLERI